MRKKISVLLLCLVCMMVFLLASCVSRPDLQKKLDEIVDQVSITYAPGDTANSVTRNFEVPVLIEEATITWSSSDALAVVFLGNQGVVSRASQDKVVVISATVTLANLSEELDFTITIEALAVVDVYYTITWNIDGVITTTSVKVGDIPTKEDPVKEGYTFVGWDKEVVAASANVTYTAVFSENEADVYYTITWNIDGVVTTTSVKEGVIPTKEDPVKEGYTFVSWDKEIVAASADVTYTAVFSKNPVDPSSNVEDDINELAGENITDSLPKITTNDYEVFDEASDEYPIDIYIDIFDWDEDAALSYIDALDLLLEYDNSEQAWIYNDFFISVYEDDKTYDFVVYGINIYTKKETEDPGDPSSNVEDDINELAGENITDSLPKITTNDYEVFDESSSDYPIDIYVDIFDWDEDAALNYMDALDLLLEYDDDEKAWIYNNFFISVYEEDELYDFVVYGINIYTKKETEDPGDPGDPSSNVEDDINALAGEDITKSLPKISTNDYEVFDESSSDYPIDIYVDIFDWDYDAALSYMDALDLLLQYDDEEEAWVYKNFFISVYEEDELYDFVVYGINIYTKKETEDPGDPGDPGIPGESYSVTIDSKYQSSSSINANGNINSHLTFVNSGNATFTVSFTKNNSAHDTIFNNSGNEIRLYPGNKNGGELLIAINSDYMITAVTVVTGAKNNQLGINNEFFSTKVDSTINYAFANPVASVALKNVANIESGDRIDLKEIIITYQAVEGGEVEPEAPLTEGEVASIGNEMLNLNQWQLSLVDKYSGVPSIGKFDVLVIPVEIKGALFDANYHDKIDLAFNGTEVETGWQSVATYYYLSSYGKLDLNFDVLEKYSSPNNKAYFEDFGEYADEYAIYEAVMALNPSVDFSKYDYNDDGIIDGVIFVYSADYSTTVDSWWAWVFDASYFEYHTRPTLDGLKLGYYMWVSYDFMNDDLAIPVNVNAETYIHEMGHMLGQTDLYSGDESKYSGPLGDFDMMDYNSGDHGPFSKLLWGWVDPMVCNPGYQYSITLDSYATDDDGIDSVILIPRSNANFADKNYFDEYLLIIFYTPEGLYNAHKGSNVGVNQAGIVIYQIDARLNSELDYWSFFLNDNNGNSNFLAQILEADKNSSIPSSSNKNIDVSDFLTSGSLDLSSYNWNQGGKINVSIELTAPINNTSSSANIVVAVR